MSVRTNAQGRFIVDIIWPDGIRTRSRMPDEQTAGRINKKIEVAIVDEQRIWRKLRKELRLEQSQVVSFSDLADRYLKEYVNIYNRDIRVKKSRLDVLKAYYGKQSTDCLNLRSVTQFITFKKAEGVTNATVNRYIALLKHMGTWACEREIVESNPFSKLGKLEEVEWIGTRPDDALIEKVFEKIDFRVIPIFWFMRETGCRKGEAISLKSSQIDFSGQIVTFHGKTKSGKSRQVPLTDKALWAVQALPPQGSTVFYHPEYLSPYTGDGLSWFWDRARGSIKLRPHDLRHAFAIRLAEDGCPMHYISEIMGHHSIEFTRRRYARFSPESASRAVLRVLQGRKAEPAWALAQNWHS